MNWILLTTLAQFLNAIVAVVDKYIVSDEKLLPKPFVYAFYSCLLTGFWAAIYFLGLIPQLDALGVPSLLNVSSPTIQVVSMSFLSAYTFFMALVSLYDALKHADTSNIIPIIGAISALSTFGLNYLFLDAAFTFNHILGILLLSLGTLLVANTLPSLSVAMHAIHSGLFFAFHYITMKGLFIETTFENGFFWSRISFVLFAFSLLLVPVYLSKIKDQTKSSNKKTSILVIGNKVLAGVAAFMILKATDVGNVAVVQALDGLKFVFILILTTLFVHWLPDSAVDHDNRPRVIVQKFVYVILILTGFLVVFAW
jgi:uncharacterized membrane protein